MNESDDQLAIAEKYLDEMLEAENMNNYQSWIKRFEQTDLADFNESIFAEDIKQMNEDLGSYKSRVYLGSLNGFKNDNHPESTRFVWSGVFEKTEMVIVLGIHKRGDTWHVHQCQYL
jgi:hypothetical protein